MAHLQDLQNQTIIFDQHSITPRTFASILSLNQAHASRLRKSRRLKRADRLYWRDKKGATEMGKLDGKVAIVTGAGRGIGRAIAQTYLQEGAKVVVTAAREQAELDQLAKQDGSERVLALLADVTNPETCEQVVEQSIQRFGH